MTDGGQRIARLLRVATCAAVLAAAPAARADKVQDADRYFKEGQSLMEAEEFAKACPKFEQSYRLDPKTGTQLNLAFCYEKEGRVWYAWLAYKETELRATAGGQKDRADFARQRATELERTLARAKLSDKAGIDKLTIDEQAIPDAQRGTPFAVEPGTRKVTFVRTGKKPVVREIKIVKQAAPQVLEAPTVFEDEDPGPVTPPDPDRPPPPDVKKPFAPNHTPAIAAFGVGAFGIGVGAVFGILTFTKVGDADPNCPNKVCDRTGQDKIDTARTYSWVSTGGFVVGGLGVAAGAALMLLAPSGEKVAWVLPAIGSDRAGLAVGARF